VEPDSLDPDPAFQVNPDPPDPIRILWIQSESWYGSNTDPGF
jgi:hypothetical protein